MKNLIPASDKELLEKFIIKNNFSKSFPYFYKVIDIKHNPNKIFYILIRSIDDIANIKQFFPNSNAFPYNAENLLKPYWKGCYNKEKINIYDFIELDKSKNEKNFIFPFENKTCTVEIRKTSLKIDHEGNKVGEEDFFTYKLGNKYILKGFNFDFFYNSSFSEELIFFTSENIGQRILIIFQMSKNIKYYGITDPKKTFFIPLIYEKYILKDDYIFLYSYPKLKLTKSKNGFDYYIIERNKIEGEEKIARFNILSKSIENQEYINLNEFNSFNHPDKIYLSDIDDPSIQNLIKYIVASKNEIKVFTFFVILQKIKKENLKLNYNQNLFEFVDAIIKIEPELIQGVYGVTERSCYLATHIYKDINHPKVEIYRKYRDNVLVKYFLGRIFIKFYYKFSPSLVIKLKTKTVLNNAIKIFLDMIVTFIK